MGVDRSVVELAWRSEEEGAQSIVLRFRGGTYSPSQLLGSEQAARDGFEKRPDYFSAYVGVQDQPPVLPWKKTDYVRAGIGVTFYRGQSSTFELPDGELGVRAQIGDQLGFGADVSLGLRAASGWLRPWAEVGVGAEMLLRAGIRFIKPLVLLGVAFGGGR